MRPAVVICGASPPELPDRLARAGFAVVSFDFADSTDLDLVLDALRRGALGLAAETYGLIGLDTGAPIALARSAGDERVRAVVTVGPTRLERGDPALRERWLDLTDSNGPVEQAIRTSIDWLARHLS